MRRSRTVTVGITPLLGDIINQAVSERALLDIVASLDSRAQLLQCLPTLRPDLILIRLCPDEDEGDGIVLTLRNAFPSVKVIALSHEGHHAYVHGPHRHRIMHTEMSLQALIKAILDF